MFTQLRGYGLYQVKWDIKIQCYLVNTGNTLNAEIPIGKTKVTAFCIIKAYLKIIFTHPFF